MKSGLFFGELLPVFNLDIFSFFNLVLGLNIFGLKVFLVVFSEKELFMDLDLFSAVF
jgi:hypothetical protein